MAEMFVLVGLRACALSMWLNVSSLRLKRPKDTRVSRSETSDVVVGQLTGIGRRRYLKIEVQLPQRPVGRPW